MIDGRFLVAGALALVLLSERPVVVSGEPLREGQVRALAQEMFKRHNLFAEPPLVVRIAWIESSFNPTAQRSEPLIGDESVGLMQTLVKTARWLASAMGYSAYGVPDRNDLADPRKSLYFGMAYLDYLKKKGRGEEWTVRSYNGGPGHSRAATDGYWRKYLAAKERFG